VSWPYVLRFPPLLRVEQVLRQCFNAATLGERRTVHWHCRSTRTFAVVVDEIGMVVGRALCIWQVGRVEVALEVTTVVALSAAVH